MKTTTDELRKLLDRRGVAWGYGEHPHTSTKYKHGDITYLVDETYFDDDMYDFLQFTNVTPITPEPIVDITLGPKITGETSDGYHTFNELYHHRALLFSVIVHDHREIAWKSRKHHDGTMYDGMFIVGVETPWGQATYHYDYDPYWPMFDCRELLTAPEWDGHTPSEAIERIARLASMADDTCHIEGPRVADTLEHDCPEFILYCDQCGHGFGYVNYNDEGKAWMNETPRFCPNCGRRIWQP